MALSCVACIMHIFAQTEGPEALVVPRGTGLGPNLIDRPHTVALVEAGIMALPSAPISAALRGGQTPFGSFGKGDATMQVGIHVLFRATPEWALGAGIIFGPTPTTAEGLVPGTMMKRSHSRSYYTIGAEVRYYPIRSRWVEAWAGLTAGAVVVADRFATEEGPERPKILGLREASISQEGLTMGAQVGGDWMFAERWVTGVALRSERWILPSERARSSFGDTSTLVGIVEVFQVVVNVGYRMPL